MKKVETLKKLLSEAALMEYAGRTIFSRGQNYYESGAVYLLLEQDDKLLGKIEGTYEYTARFWIEDGVLDYDCTCPYNDFCKHLVAVGLAYLHGESETVFDPVVFKAEFADLDRYQEVDDTENDEPSTQRSTENTLAILPKKMSRMREFLNSLSKDRLVAFVLESAVENKAFQEKLELKALLNAGKETDLAALRKVFDKATKFGNYIEYGEARSYADRAEQALNAIEEVYRRGRTDGIVELFEHAADRLDKAICAADDSNGYISAVLERASSMHLEACRKIKPDPDLLAEKLFRNDLHCRMAMSNIGGDYDDILGETGRKRYRELIRAAWEKLPATDSKIRDESSLPRFFLTQAMKRMTEESGDVDERLAIIEKDLSRASAYLEAAEILKKAKRLPEAIDWAEKGIKKFNYGWESENLRAFLADEYHRGKRDEEAVGLYWDVFKSSMMLKSYRDLKKQAERAKSWTGWRERAMSHIYENVNRATGKGKKTGADSDNQVEYANSRLVEILLWEGQNEEAWKEAQTHGCSESLWLKLAAIRESANPVDCIPIYQKLAERLLQPADKQAYSQAAAALKKLGELMNRVGNGDKFKSIMHDTRTKFKIRKNLIKALDKLKLP